MIKVEYLLPFDTKEGICKNIISFKSLISSNSNFKFKKNKINFKGSLYTIDISLNRVDNKETSVFHVVFATTKMSDKFRQMLKAFRKTLGPYLKDNILLIWDGVSFEWCKDLYPRIYSVENSLRKLISKFMLINLGIGWHKSSVPKDVADSIKQENYKPSQNILYEVDFIQLANFLFKTYTIKDPQKLPDILSDIIENGMDEKKKQEILDFLPKNNWDRYFSEIVEIESEQLNKKWKILYELRNKVAHNKSMNYEEYKNAKSLCDELNNIIQKAIEDIDKIKIPEKDKESIGLKTMGTIDDFTNFISNKYLNINNTLENYLDIEIKNNLDYLLKNELFEKTDDFNSLFTLNKLKDDILSGNTINLVSDDEIKNLASIDIENILKKIESDKEKENIHKDANTKDRDEDESSEEKKDKELDNEKNNKSDDEGDNDEETK